MRGNNKRFEVVYKQGAVDICRILLDKETGVNYLQTINGYAGGLTPLIDKEGKPIISKGGHSY